MWQKIRPIFLTILFIYCVGNLPIWVDNAIWRGLIALSPVIWGIFWTLDKENNDDRNESFGTR